MFFFIVHKSFVIARVVVDKSYLSFFTEKGLFIFPKAFIVTDPNWIKTYFPGFFVTSATEILLFFKLC